MRLLLAILAMLLLPPLTFAASAAGASINDLTARRASYNYAPLPPVGRPGDATSSRWILRDRHARVVGDISFDCRWVTGALRLCVGQMSMPLGSLALLGSSRTMFVGQLSVVGGTGVYRRAMGVLTFDAIGVSRYVVGVDYTN